jgi:hypothetical protein
MLGANINEVLDIFSEDDRYIIFSGYNNIAILVLTLIMFPVQ